MHPIYFYRDAQGRRPIADYIAEMSHKSDKDSRIKLNKLRDYIKMLSLYGTQAGEPYIKHLDGDIWELRPIRGRILFAAWYQGGFVLLHHFMKQTQKTPVREIARAKQNLADLIERGVIYEQE